MATAYTAIICEKPDVTFEDFIFRCAREFGALYRLRDTSLDTPLPNEIKPSQYHQGRCDEILLKIVNVKAMTDAECIEQAKKEAEDAEKERIETIQRNARNKKSYLNMIALVEQWNPPTTDHVKLKDFMLTQLQESIESDCRPIDNEIWGRIIGNSKYKTINANWRADKLAKLYEDLDYHQQKQTKENEICAESTQWIKDLRMSLEANNA